METDIIRNVNTTRNNSLHAASVGYWSTISYHNSDIISIFKLASNVVWYWCIMMYDDGVMCGVIIICIRKSKIYFNTKANFASIVGLALLAQSCMQ